MTLNTVRRRVRDDRNTLAVVVDDETREEQRAAELADLNLQQRAFTALLGRVDEARYPGVRRGPDSAPRGAAVHQIDACARGARPAHLQTVRGSMWAAFTPRRGLEPGRAVISAADLGLGSLTPHPQTRRRVSAPSVRASI